MGLNSSNEERGKYVVVYVDNEKIGTCDTREEYEEFVDGLYEELFHAFPHDVVRPEEDDEELWQD
jgi:hypothetical protein